MAYNVKSPILPRVPGLRTTLPHHVHIADKPIIHTIGPKMREP
jgi:hypothetical protein